MSNQSHSWSQPVEIVPYCIFCGELTDNIETYSSFKYHLDGSSTSTTTPYPAHKKCIWLRRLYTVGAFLGGLSIAVWLGIGSFSLSAFWAIVLGILALGIGFAATQARNIFIGMIVNDKDLQKKPTQTHDE